MRVRPCEPWQRYCCRIWRASSGPQPWDVMNSSSVIPWGTGMRVELEWSWSGVDPGPSATTWDDGKQPGSDQEAT